jgi:hypothetical protein
VRSGRVCSSLRFSLLKVFLARRFLWHHRHLPFVRVVSAPQFSASFDVWFLRQQRAPVFGLGADSLAPALDFVSRSSSTICSRFPEEHIAGFVFRCRISSQVGFLTCSFFGRMVGTDFSVAKAAALRGYRFPLRFRFTT